MLLSNRVFEVPRLQSRFGEHGVLHSRFRLFVSERIGITVDERFFGKRIRHLESDRSQLLVVLEGEARVRSAEGSFQLEAGDTAALRRSMGWRSRLEGPLLSLLIEWEPGSLGTKLIEPGSGPRLSPVVRRRLRRAIGPLSTPGTDPAASVQEVLAILRAEGFPFDPLEAGELREPAPEPLARLSRALDQTLSSLPDRPMSVDLETALGWSRRHVHRKLAQFHDRYAFNASSWRELLQAWRLFMGTALMSAERARTEDVAALLGYGSVSSFYNAYADAGLPSPSAFREFLRSND